METSVSISFDRIIRDNLWRWSTYFGRNKIRRSIFDKRVLFPNYGIRKKTKICQEPFLLVNPFKSENVPFSSGIPLISDPSVSRNGSALVVCGDSNNASLSFSLCSNPADLPYSVKDFVFSLSRKIASNLAALICHAEMTPLPSKVSTGCT